VPLKKLASLEDNLENNSEKGEYRADKIFGVAFLDLPSDSYMMIGVY